MLKHLTKDVIQTNMLLNHIIILFNCFGDAALHMLFFKVDKEYWNTLITFLIYINRMPESLPEYGIDLALITLDENIIKELRKI